MEKYKIKMNIKDFMFAGKAIFTIRNSKTQGRFTFKIKKFAPKNKDNCLYFVSVLCGTDNENSYKFIGTVFSNDSFKHSEKSKIGIDAVSFKAFSWFYENVVKKRKEYPSLEFYHAGRCCRCGRTLTVPESIESGIGPECAKLHSN